MTTAIGGGFLSFIKKIPTASAKLDPHIVIRI
jgi:hypothetical protein